MSYKVKGLITTEDGVGLVGVLRCHLSGCFHYYEDPPSHDFVRSSERQSQAE